jgi:hypothetical protein
MAGAFGCGGKYDISRKWPSTSCDPGFAVHRGTMVVADGFSCRSQIADLAGGEAVTQPEALKRGLPVGGADRPGPFSGQPSLSCRRTPGASIFSATAT